MINSSSVIVDCWFCPSAIYAHSKSHLIYMCSVQFITNYTNTKLELSLAHTHKSFCVCVCFVQNYTALFIFKSYNQDKCYKSCNHMHHQQIMVWVWKVKTMEQSLFNLYNQQGETALQINVLCFNLCRRSLQISLLSYIPFSLFQVWR